MKYKTVYLVRVFYIKHEYCMTGEREETIEDDTLQLFASKKTMQKEYGNLLQSEELCRKNGVAFMDYLPDGTYHYYTEEKLYY